MKTKNVRFTSKLLLFLLLPFLAEAQYSKSFTKSFPAQTALTIEHRRGDLIVEKATDDTFRYELNVSFDARSDEDAAQVMEAISMVTRVTANRRTLSTATNIKGIVSMNGRTTLQLADGTKIRGIDDLEIDLVIYTPPLVDLEITHKYHEVRIADKVTQHLRANLNSCEIELGDINGTLFLESKHTKGLIGQVGTAELDLYDCDLTFGDLGDARLSSKYSELDFQRLASLDMDTYDDDIEAALVDGALTITDKYSEIEIGQCGNARLDVYDSQIDIRQGGNLQAKSKYTEFELGKMYVLDFQLSYDDNLQVDYATSLQVESSKYTSYEFGELSRRLEIQSYEDKIQIDRVSGQFAALTFDGKYTSMELDLSAAAAYRLRVDTKYGDLDMNEDAFDFQIWKEKNDVLEAEGRSKRANDNSPLFTIKGYDNNIRLK